MVQIEMILLLAILSIVTALCISSIHDGWIMVTRGEYKKPSEWFVIWITRLLKGDEAARGLESFYMEPARVKRFGVFRLIVSLFVFAVLVFLFVVTLVKLL